MMANIWKEMGWNSIIYIAAISGIDPSLYEVAELDGAKRFRKMWHVTLPGIRSTIVVLLIMNLGWILNAGFEVQYLLGGGPLQDVSQTIDIFVLKYGINIGNYSLATAAGIFKSIISIVLVFGTNQLANKLGENSLM
jgi:putative aldouronate transport system permease protein